MPRASFNDDPIDYLIGKFWLIFGPLFGLGLAAVLCGAAYQGMNDAGWITHHQDMGTYFEGDWINAEYRNCTSYHAIDTLDCGGQIAGKRARLLPVKFHGRIDRTDHNYFTWRCQRSEKGLECWALD